MLRNLSVLLLVISLGLISCSKKDPNVNLKNTLRVDIEMEPPTLDPVLAEDAYAFRVVNDLFAGLVDWDQSNKPIPGMAKSWNISPDGMIYTFHLRRNLKFSDGTPITANDFVYSWQRVIDPKTASPYNFLLKSIVNASNIADGKLPPNKLGVRAIDNYTFVVNLAYPNNAFLSYITVPDVFVVPQHTIEKYGNTWTTPEHIVTSGAYTLKEHVLNGHILAEKNPNFYDAAQVRINNIEYFPYTDVNVSLANYKTNSLDTTWQNVPVDQYANLKHKYPNEMHTVQWERLDFLVFNMKSPKYADNIKLRQALTIAIDRNVIVNNVLKSGQIPLYSVVTPTIENGLYKDVKYSWANLPNNQQIKQAKQLYKEAGYSLKNPLKLTLSYRTNDLYKKVAIAISSMWYSALGVQV
ncbi:MAG: peptide ABC transporter substrate-binding protein, partial [Burkholderiales bacterium]|nr:peptide ABC transporter substrate-binding protein [Burkholderiales bacterium]